MITLPSKSLIYCSRWCTLMATEVLCVVDREFMRRLSLFDTSFLYFQHLRCQRVRTFGSPAVKPYQEGVSASRSSINTSSGREPFRLMQNKTFVSIELTRKVISVTNSSNYLRRFRSRIDALRSLNILWLYCKPRLPLRPSYS